MDYLLGKKFKKNKNTTSSSSNDKSGNKEDDKIRKQIEKEIKKQEKLSQKSKSDNLRQMSQGNGGNAPHLGQGNMSNGSSNSNGVETSDNKPDSEGGKYHVSEIIKVIIPPNKKYDLQMDYLDNNSKNSSSMWAVDGMLIDEELLYAEDEEADRIYQELKARSFRRRKMEESENRLSNAMMHDQDIEEEEDQRKESRLSQSNQSFEKIKAFIKKSNQQEKLEFTQGLLNFANKIDKRFLTEGLLPNLQILAAENQDIKKALLDQFIPLISYIREQCGQEGYDKTVMTIFPLLDNLLYDAKEQTRDKAIQVLLDIRNVLQQKENDYVMNLTLKLAHDDNEMNRTSAIKILNELAPDMGQTLCESYIVPEIKSLGIDESVFVRQTVAKNLLNTSKIISLDWFTAHIFPLYDRLSQDKDEKVRKTCAEVVAEIAQVSPLDKKGQALSDLYYRFLKDPTSKIVRGTAFQNIGPFIAALKEMKTIDPRIIDFYVSTTENSSNKDVCYYSSFNFPAFIYTLGRENWETFRKIYIKLSKFNDGRIKKTLAHSIHELARILGPEITEEDLVPVMEKFLSYNVNEIKIGALKNLHIFLAEVHPENRGVFIKYIMQTYDDFQKDWRGKMVLAQNLGKFAQLYDQDTVYNSFLQMFFKFCYDEVAKVSETASTSLVYMLEKFSNDIHKQDSIVKVVKKNFLYAKTFKRRQLFVLMCGEAMNRKELFERHFKADMLALVNDRVSNVRMSLAKVLRHHFINQISGAFVFDIDVNDAVKILKRDRAMDVRQHVQDIQTFPINEDGDVNMSDYLSRLSTLNNTMVASVSDQEEQEVEKQVNLEQIIQDSNSSRVSGTDSPNKSQNDEEESNSSQVQADLELSSINTSVHTDVDDAEKNLINQNDSNDTENQQ